MKRTASVLLALVVGASAWAQADLVGAGATFPQPLYTKMFDVYSKDTRVRVNYQGIGSGGGIQQLVSKTVDFGASDAFLSDEQLAAAPARIVHIPVVAGAVVLTYNLPFESIAGLEDKGGRRHLGQLADRHRSQGQPRGGEPRQAPPGRPRLR